MAYNINTPPTKEEHMTSSTADIRECSVWIKYTDGKEVNLKAWFDIDSSIEDQVYMSFNPLNPDYPQIADFKWDLVKESLAQVTT